MVRSQEVDGIRAFFRAKLLRGISARLNRRSYSSGCNVWQTGAVRAFTRQRYARM
jgi:hypothetical protein